MKKFSSTRVLMSYNQFISDLGDYSIVCVDNAVLGAIRVLIRSYGLRYANWVTAYSEAGYYEPTQAEMDVIDAKISEFLEETNDMSTCNDFVTALQDIAAAISSGSGCGCGAAGAGETEPPPSTEQPGEPDNPQPGDSVPDGFADYAEYNTYKCNVAEWIVQQVETDLSWWSTASFSTLALSAFIAALVTPIPGDEIVIMLGWLASLAIQGVAAAAVTEMQDAVSNNRDDIICALYTGTDASSSQSQVGSEISSGIDAETSAIYAPLLKSILESMFGLTNINRMYNKWSEKIPSLPTGSCDCGVCSPDTLVGTDNEDGSWATELFAPASDPPGKNVISIEFKIGASGCTKDDVVITPTNINPTAGGGFKGYQLYDSALTLIYNQDTAPPSTDGVRKIVVQSNTAGSITLSYT